MTNRASGGLVSVEMGPRGAALVKVDGHNSHSARLSICEYHEGASALKQKNALSDAVVKYGLTGCDCNLVLHPSEYQLLLVEAPKVAPQELKQAMKWRVKDLVTEPLDSMIIDIFPLPGDAFHGRAAMVYVVAAVEEVVKRHALTVKDCGLNVVSIDIPELCLRNLTALVEPNGQESVGLLMLRESGGLINLTEGPHLYLSREIEMDVGLVAEVSDSVGLTLENKPDQSQDSLLEPLALEVQRSLDFYESQLGKGVILKMMVAPTTKDIGRVVTLLDEMLHAKVDRIDLNSRLDMGDFSPALLAQCFTTIGGALRCEAKQQVNLLSASLKPQNDWLSPLKMFAYLTLLLVTLMLASGVLSWNVNSIKADLETAHSRLQLMESELRELQSLQDEMTPKAIQNLADQIAAAEQTLARRTRVATDTGYTLGYSRILESLKQAEIQGVRLKKITITQGASKFVLSGEMNKPKQLPDYITQLSQEEVFSGISFEMLELYRDNENNRSIGFTLATKSE